jgi:hypothetical protein
MALTQYHVYWCTILTARKLLEPLSTIIQNTGAKSLQYECIHTVTLALPFTKREDGSDSKNAPAVVKLCSDYLRVRTVCMIMLPILVFALTLTLRPTLMLLLILIDTNSAIALYVTHHLHVSMNHTAQSHSYVQCSNAYSCLEHPRNR